MQKIGESLEREHIKACGICGKGVLHSGLPLCYRVTIERLGFDLQAIQQAHGLELMLGNAALANVMGPTREFAKPFIEPIQFLVCETCSTGETHCVAALAEMNEPEEKPEPEPAETEAPRVAAEP